MNEIQDININKPEAKLTNKDDPVALKVDWSPASLDGANYRNKEMKVLSDKVIIKKTIGALGFGILFIVMGSVGLLIGINVINNDIYSGVFMLLGGVGIVAVGILASISDKKITIDKSNGFYYRGKVSKRLNSQDRTQQGYIEDIYAIQTIEKEKSFKVRDDPQIHTYISYEINLVFKDGERMNLMKSAKEKYMDDSAKALSVFLNIPLWKEQ